jgi:hypothetical protein
VLDFWVAVVWSAVTALLALTSSSLHLALKARRMDSDQIMHQHGLRQAPWNLWRTHNEDSGCAASKEIADAGQRRELRVIDWEG